MSLSLETLSVDERTGILYRSGTFDLWIINETKGYFPLKLDNKDVVIDIGGHIGAFASRTMMEKKVPLISIEAEESNYSVLAFNSEKFDFPAVKAAVVDDKLDGKPIKLYVNTLKNNALHSTLPTRGRVEQTTAGFGFSRFLEMKPTVMKCDIEGGEFSLPWEVIENSEVRMVIMELHLSRKGFREKAQEMITRFNLMGFGLTRIPKIGEKNWTTLAAWQR